MPSGAHLKRKNIFVKAVKNPVICVMVNRSLFHGNYTILDEVILPHSHLKLRSDGIVMITYPDHVAFTIRESIESVNAIGEITKGIPHPILKIPGKYTTVDRDTREHVAKGDGARFSIAEAFIIRSLAHKLVGNFYLSVEKPQKPTRFFSDIPSAETWLGTYRRK
ncbi:MAG: hypothetical protein JWO44_1509 [Bacteroidetes bacterium]|jgi:hypothetical protein|nr:hypothetical protein [Bacteroidota bacterium]